MRVRIILSVGVIGGCCWGVDMDGVMLFGVVIFCVVLMMVVLD